MEKMLVNGLLVNLAFIIFLSIVFFSFIQKKKGSKITRIAIIIFILLIIWSSVKLLCLMYFYDEAIGITQRTYYSGRAPKKVVEYQYSYKGEIYYGTKTYPRNLKNFKIEGGKYKVRVFSFYPAWDIIDFSEPVDE
ncbi:MAG: hypothetical protein ACK4TA_10145 [Saprospiraceae bacterium]